MNARLKIQEDTWNKIETLINELEYIRRGSEKTLKPLPKPFFNNIEAFTNLFDIDEVDSIILIFSVAPTVNPRLGWLYREFQAGDISGLPGIDLICELLRLTPEQSVVYRNRVNHEATLVKQGFLVRETWKPFAPLVPTSRVLQTLFGLTPDGDEIPGAIKISSPGNTEVPLLEQLVCSPTIKHQLSSVARWPFHDEQLRKWNIPVEHGPVILLAGPSGCGKTMAARAIAEKTGKLLYRVDMGQLVSKYIGETSKQITRLFAHARRENAILLFDEAESLFGKRGNIVDARDRYANMEVGHLLSSIEQYPGMCLLTTNLKSHIDDAFLRRIDAILQFNYTSESQRNRLWKLYFGNMLSTRSAKIWADKISKKPSLSGAQIAAACRYAARQVADVKKDKYGRPKLAQVLTALGEGVWCEMSKHNTNNTRSSLGELEEYLPG